MSRTPLVEIVPNFSEGRRPEVMDAIVDALQVPGVLLLNRQADPEHNRLDCSLIGDPDAVRRSALAGAAKALELIDMERHRGSHPRMGAVDVIPFIPVRDITMDECVELARDFARELAETLGLPVYCYDRAALSLERRSLADVRKGEYEGLKADVAAGARLPDFGPNEIGRGGAVAVGARKLLIAFNVYLSGRDEEAARDVARSVRESSGGLPAVRAIGFAVPERGCVTVSMNLVDHEVTGLRAAFESVRAGAALHGMEVLGSEIVGLVPEAALTDAAVGSLKLEGFDPEEQVLENLVRRADAGRAGEGIGSRRVKELLEAVASAEPTPGGGSAAALSGAMGAALVAMVGRLTIGKKGYEAAEERMRAVVRESNEARASLLALADRDAEAFDGVMAAFKLAKETDEEKAVRSAAIQRAFADAADVPLQVARRAVGLMELALECVEKGNAAAASDAAAAGHVLFAAMEAAIANVEINLASPKDRELAARLRGEVESLRQRGRDLLAATEAAFRRRLSS